MTLGVRVQPGIPWESTKFYFQGTSRDVERVRGFLGWLNREVLRPVTLSVHGYAVRMEREAGYGFGLAAVNAG